MYQTESSSGDKVSLEFSGQELIYNGQPFNWSLEKKRKDLYLVLKDNKSFRAELLELDHQAKKVTIKVNKTIYEISLKDKMDLLLAEMGIDASSLNQVNDLKAPMPGLILDILVEPDQEVKKGDQLMILEAMKMENVLKAPGDGQVKSVEVSKGDSVEKNQVLIKF